MRRLAFAVLALFSGRAFDDNETLSALNEEIVQIPLVLNEGPCKKKISLHGTVFHPDGEGPFPLIVLSHGSPLLPGDRSRLGRFRQIPQIKEFMKRGFAVIVPIRRGYGATGGLYAEDCRQGNYFSFMNAGIEAAKDLLATVEFAKGLPFVKSDQVLLAGQSAGGFATLATASLNPPGVIAAVNFSGGRGGNPYQHPGIPYGAASMADTVATFASTTTVPVLWHYVENDLFFGPQYASSWFAAFQRAGGKGKLVIQPPFGEDGHFLFYSNNGIPIWTAEFDRFLKESVYPANSSITL